MHRQKAIVTDRLGPVSYLVRLEKGKPWRRHVDHLQVGQAAPAMELAEPGEENTSDPTGPETGEAVPSPTEKGNTTRHADNDPQTGSVEVSPSILPPEPDRGSTIESNYPPTESPCYPARTHKKPHWLYGTVHL